MHKMWENIDGILVINLDSCTERMEQFRERNAGALPMEKVHRISAVYGRELPTYGQSPWFTERTGERAKYWGGAAGCVLSHRKAIEKAHAEGWRNVLILEDDVAVGTDAHSCDLLARSLGQMQGAYMLYMGYSRPTPYGRKVGENAGVTLWRTEGVLSTFAYMVSQGMYARLLAALPTEDNVWDWLSRHRAIDTFYKDTAARMSGVQIFCIQPDLVEHIDGESCIGAITRTDMYSREQLPHSYATPAGVLHLLSAPLRRLKIKLNAIRTHRRAVKGGFPGPRKRKK